MRPVGGADMCSVQATERHKNRQTGDFYVKNLTKLYYRDMLFLVREK